ncbi:ATP-grasp domain-containing protein [Urbifossiella limnaea]|uniref:Carbamoyl phosphate synthase-like protein n=1 Tax=Urbifossiella limnaea TaxID=2528023 RepID=A0A517XS20_9BACT|nr:ATP-grasp domain-containing protein [Urbifossiella limnaea]QDU20305.1 carbamoyl phosphate synthase-like protein [Urbifossiella limnaea]
MKVVVYEYLTARGLVTDPMYAEGRAMRDAVAADFAALPGCAVVTPDADDAAAFAAADWALVVAPESDGILLDRCRRVLDAGGRLLGPSLAAVELTSDKLALHDHWRARAVPTPATTDRAPTACEAFPVVWKPRDGCGSTATFLLRDRFELVQAQALAAEEYPGPMILQEYVPGVAASVGFLCGPEGNVPLLPTTQILSADGRFHYRGGELPLPPALAERAVSLATRAVACVPGLCGYVGVDLILGDGRDVAVEINPRLTTSYVGLRALAADNLAAALLRVAGGDVRRPVRWHDGGVRFASDGTVVHATFKSG